MAIAPGRKLGPYEFLSPLGAGGMEEVYKAEGGPCRPVEARLSFPRQAPQVRLPSSRFEGPYLNDSTGHASNDVSPDGRRFLMIRNQEGGLTELRVVLNFREEPKALVYK